MATYSNTNATGNGSAALGFSFPVYLLGKLSTLGPQVSQPPSGEADQALNAGWLAFGSTQNPFGDGSEIYWFDPIWLNFTRRHWPFDPTRIAGAFADFAADHIRWHLSPGTVAKIFVFGS